MSALQDSHRKLDGWRVCRIDPVFSLDPSKREYGHWWIEVGPDESYGFWPEQPVGGLLETVLGVPGKVNRGSFSPNARRDLHHGEQSSDGSLAEFDVLAPVGIDADQLLEQVRDFANAFDARWAWPATRWTGENCHTFQEKLLSRFDLRITKR